MQLPDKDHPIWKVLQLALIIVLLAIGGRHFAAGEHTGPGDAGDYATLSGTAIALRLVVSLLGTPKA